MARGHREGDEDVVGAQGVSQGAQQTPAPASPVLAATQSVVAGGGGAVESEPASQHAPSKGGELGEPECLQLLVELRHCRRWDVRGRDGLQPATNH